MMSRSIQLAGCLLLACLAGCRPAADSEKATADTHSQYQVVFYDTATMTLITSIAFPKQLADHPEQRVVTHGQRIAPDQFDTEAPIEMLLKIQGNSTHAPGQHLVISATPCQSVSQGETAAGQLEWRCEKPLDDTRPTEVTLREHTLPLPVTMAYGLTAAIADGG